MNSKLLSMFAAVALLLGAVSCADDDTADNGTHGSSQTFGNLTTFTAQAPDATRTSLDYDNEKYFWEDGDRIWVLDDTNTWQQSTNFVTGNKVAGFAFTVPGSYTGTSYPVVYHGDTQPDNQVEIATAQTQEKPNDTKHFGSAGDNGIATATKNGSKYDFALSHKAAYLVFEPYTTNPVLRNSCYLTKIEINADHNIAGTFTLNPLTNQLDGTGTANRIILTTKGASGSTTEKGFSLNTSSASITTNGAYMVIAPGTHKLTVRYWVKDYVTNVEGAITKTYASHYYQANSYYDLKANLKIEDYSQRRYWEWDAKKHYWEGFETSQPMMNGASSEDYPKSNATPLDERSFICWDWNSIGFSTVHTPSNTAMSCPSANETAWYILRGDPHWDNITPWQFGNHIYVGGVWFKKQTQISGFTDASAPSEASLYYYNPIASATPTIGRPIDTSTYFFLPALGQYGTMFGPPPAYTATIPIGNGTITGSDAHMYAKGNLNGLGSIGNYWTRTATNWDASFTDCAYTLRLEQGTVKLVQNDDGYLTSNSAYGKQYWTVK